MTAIPHTRVLALAYGAAVPNPHSKKLCNGQDNHCTVLRPEPSQLPRGRQQENRRLRHGVDALMNALAIPLGVDLVETLAQRAAQIVLAQMADRPEYMGTEEIAAYLGWPKKRIDNLSCERRIPFHKDGGRRLFIRQEIDEWATQLDGPRVTGALAMAN